MTLGKLFLIYGILMFVFIKLDLGLLAIIATVVTFLLIPHATANSDSYVGNDYTRMRDKLIDYKNITTFNPGLDIKGKGDRK